MTLLTRRLIGLLLPAALLAACQSVTAIEPGDRFTLDNRWSLESPAGWTRIDLPAGQGTVFTADGLELNEVRFFPVIEPGESLFRVDDEVDIGAYTGDMTGLDIVELVERTYEAAGVSNFKTDSVAAFSVSPRPGVRFAYRFALPNGLLMQGLAVALHDETALHLITFEAPQEHYFAASRPAIEGIFNSLQFVGGPTS